MVITGLVTILCLPHAYSDFSPNNQYVIKALGYLSGNQTILDSSIALELTTGSMNGSAIQSTLDNGLVTISHVQYLNSGIWQTPILRDGKYFVIKGDAQDQNGNIIHLNLFGRIINSNQQGSVYTITGKITGSETMKVSYSAKIISTNTVTKPTTTLTTAPTQQSSSNTVNVSIVYHGSDFYNQVHFNPSSIQAAVGTTIVWTNNDVVPHRIMSGVAKATTADGSTPVFTADGKIDSGILAPGQSFQYTITGFNTTSRLSSTMAQIYNIPPEQTLGDITFFDPTYPFMVGIISPLTSPPPAQGNIVQMTIVQGASDPNNLQFLSPSSIRITSGTTLKFINNDSVPHRMQTGQILITSQGGAKGSAPAKQPQFNPDGMFDTGAIAPGQYYTVTVTKTGTIHIFDPSFTWINGVVVSSSTSSSVSIPPIQISIALGSSIQNGAASQQQFNQYNSYYYPDTIQVVPGTPIIWVNNDSIAHTILSGRSTQQYATNPFIPDGKIVSGPIAPGQTYTAIINDTGIIRFYDPQYTWMNGVIISMPPTQSYVLGTTPNLR
jgi:plastocyanin